MTTSKDFQAMENLFIDALNKLNELGYRKDSDTGEWIYDQEMRDAFVSASETSEDS